MLAAVDRECAFSSSSRAASVTPTLARVYRGGRARRCKASWTLPSTVDRHAHSRYLSREFPWVRRHRAYPLIECTRGPRPPAHPVFGTSTPDSSGRRSCQPSAATRQDRREYDGRRRVIVRTVAALRTWSRLRSTVLVASPPFRVGNEPGDGRRNANRPWKLSPGSRTRRSRSKRRTRSIRRSSRATSWGGDERVARLYGQTRRFYVRRVSPSERERVAPCSSMSRPAGGRYLVHTYSHGLQSINAATTERDSSSTRRRPDPSRLPRSLRSYVLPARSARVPVGRPRPWDRLHLLHELPRRPTAARLRRTGSSI